MREFFVSGTYKIAVFLRPKKQFWEREREVS